MTTSSGFAATFQDTLLNNTTNTYKLTSTTGGVVNLTFLHPNGPGTGGIAMTVQLLDLLGNVIIERSLTGNAVLTTTIPSGADYYVKVIDPNIYSVNDTRPYSFTTTLTNVAGAAYDGAVNNSASSAIVGTMGAPMIGSINASDADFFKVHADGAGVLTLTFAHPYGVGTGGAAIAIDMLDASGVVALSRTLTGSGVLLATVPAAGDYYFKVYDGQLYTNDDGGIYTLTPTLASKAGTTYDGSANNTTLTAISSALGATITGTLDTGADSDFFKVHANSGGILSFDFVHPNGVGTSGRNITVTVLDSAGNTVLADSETGSDTFATSVAAAGDYYVKLNYAVTYGTLETGLYALTPTLVNVPGATYDGAINNNAANAIAAPLGAPIIGTLTSGDTDYFKFDATAAGTLSVNFAHPSGVGKAGTSIGVSIIDAAGAVVFTATERGSDLFTANLAKAGTYYLKVADVSQNTGGTYSFFAGINGPGGSTMKGSDALDRFTTGAGNDVIDGGGGRDTVVYHGSAANYQLGVTSVGVSVADRTGVDGTDTLFNVERLVFADQTIGLDISGVAGQAYRMYQAAFNRTPDAAGLGYWIGQMDTGAPLASVAAAFISSAEFKTMYGANPSNLDMLTKFYNNVLHRAPDQAGLNYWLDLLDRHLTNGTDVLAQFSESGENVAQVVGAISNGVHFVPYG